MNLFVDIFETLVLGRPDGGNSNLHIQQLIMGYFERQSPLISSMGY